MAEPVLHTDEEYVHHSKSAVFLDGFVLHLANSATIQTALEASNGDPTMNSTEGNADSGAPYCSSSHFLHENPLNPHVFRNSSAFFEDPNAQSTADFSCFAHAPVVPAHPNTQLRADCAGFSYPDVLSKDVHPHSRTVYEGLTYPHQILYGPSSVACAPSCEESVDFLREEQVDSAELYVRHEDCACPHVISKDPQTVCASSTHAGTKFQDPHVQSSRVSVHSCEESASLHEEGGDSTEPRESYEDSTFSHAGYEDLCINSEGFTYIQELRGDAANTHDGVRDASKESVDPYFQPLDAHGTSILHPCSSECSSSISMVTNATPEVTSRLDSTHMSVDGIESHWTDAKHGSYLNYMETNFVNNLFGREYCALDVCGQGPFHQGSKSSSPLPSSLFEFKSWQSGDWHRRSMLKPPLLTCIPLPLLKSPWVDHFRHHKFPHAKHQIKMENLSTACGVDGEEEVNSPLTELHSGALRHLHTSRSKTGHEEKFFCRNHSSGDEAVRVLKQDGLQELAHDTEESKTKKRGFETDIEQEPSIRCRQDRSLSDEREVVGPTK